MKRLITMLLVLLFPVLASAGPVPDYPFVHASGTAYITVIPDQGSIDFEVIVVAPTIEAAMETYAARSKAIQALTTQYGIPAEDIELGDLKRNTAKDGVNVELKATSHINVRVLASWVPLVQGLVAIPNLEGFVTEFSTSEMPKIVDELTRDALKDAFRKATVLAGGAGRKLGPANGISTGQMKNLGTAMGLVPSDFRQHRSSSARPPTDAEALLTISALKMSISVDVVYRLK